MGARGLGPPEGGMARGRFAGKPGEELAWTPQTKEHAYSYTDEPSPTRPANCRVAWPTLFAAILLPRRDRWSGYPLCSWLGGAKENSMQPSRVRPWPTARWPLSMSPAPASPHLTRT